MDDNDVDRYLKESCHSFREAKVKNSARRNSLMKKTLGIENERKMATAQISREEKQLREQLKQMKIGKKSSLAQFHKDDRKSPVKLEKKKRDIPSGDVDPYPVTFAARKSSPNRKGKFEEKGRMYAARRHRRVSKEFEDLQMNTATGKLLAAKSLHSKLEIPTSLSPSIARRILGSQTSLSSSDDLTWPGDPEAIGSVRRSRKSVVQQEQERQMQRSKTDVSTAGK